MKMKKKVLGLSVLALLSIPTLSNAEKECCDDQSRWYLDIDYLYWKPDADGLPYALVAPNGLPDDNIVLADSLLVASSRGHGHSGVRVIGGYTFCADFDTRVGFTYFNPSSCSSVAQENGVFLSSFFGVLDNDLLIGSAAFNNWCVKLMSVDWEFGYNWNVVDSLALRPHMGIKWAKIKQRQNIVYASQFEELQDPVVVKNNKFSGVGPRVGIDAAFCLWRDLSLVGSFSGALLYGDFNVSSDFAFTLETEGGPLALNPVILDCKDRLRPTAQMFIGLNWDSSCWCTDFNIAVGYEAQYWWNQIQNPPSFVGGLVGVSLQGDFMTHGLTARFGVNF